MNGRVPVYILAGGRSSRFGTDKARALVAGTPLVAGIARVLEPVATGLTVVAQQAGAYDDLGLRTIADREPGQGPLGGLLTAMDDAGTAPWLLLAACDWAGLRTEWARQLLAARHAGADCILFGDGRMQPLFALYRTAVAAIAARRLHAGAPHMTGLIEELDCVALPAPSGWAGARNINTRATLEQYQASQGEPNHA